MTELGIAENGRQVEFLERLAVDERMEGRDVGRGEIDVWEGGVVDGGERRVGWGVDWEDRWVWRWVGGGLAGVWSFA